MLDIALDTVVKLTNFLLIVVIGAGGLYAYDRFKAHEAAQFVEIARPAARAAPIASQVEPTWGQQADISQPVQSTPTYKCDGRQHCSQMRSCAEAKYFIKNCPNTKMDGDHDGIPCEDQWCK